MRLLILYEQVTLWLFGIQDSVVIYLFYYVQSSHKQHGCYTPYHIDTHEITHKLPFQMS